MAIHTRIKALILVVAFAANCQSLQLAERATQQLNPRVQFYGGWALAAPSCPSDTIKCSYFLSCCPNGQICAPGGGVPYCCPDSNDCKQQIVALPVCANGNWVMYEGEINYFCCEPGQKGVYGQAGYGVCANSDVAVPATQLASTISQIGGTFPGSPTVTSSLISQTTVTTFSTGTSTDTSIIGSPGSPTSQSTLQSSPSSTSSNNPTPSPPSSSSSSTSLSTGAIAGIVVGGVLALALIFLGALLCYRHGLRQGMRHQQQMAPGPGVATTSAPPPPLVQEYKNVIVTDQKLAYEGVVVEQERIGGRDPDQRLPEIDSRTASDGRAELGTR